MSLKLNLKFCQRSCDEAICFFIFLSNSYNGGFNDFSRHATIFFNYYFSTKPQLSLRGGTTKQSAQFQQSACCLKTTAKA